MKKSIVFVLACFTSLQIFARELPERRLRHVSSLAKKAMVFASMGDSITKGMNTDRWGDQPNHSWAAGSDSVVKSVASRLMAINPQVDLSVVNASKSGARVADVPRQLENALPKNPDFVTLLIGANDLCDGMSTPEEFDGYRHIIEQSFVNLIQANPQVKILLLAIPEMGRLRELGTGACQSFWDFFNMCPALLSSDRTSADLERFHGNWQTMNDILRDIAGKFSQNVHFGDAIEKTRFEMEHISRKDCFHPSVKGQKLLSEHAWPGPWES